MVLRVGLCLIDRDLLGLTRFTILPAHCTVCTGMSRSSRIIWGFAATGLLAAALVFSYMRFSRVFHVLLVSSVVSDHANSVALDSLQRRLRAGDIPNLHSVLVIQHDQVIAEWYFEGTDEERGIPLGVVKFGPATLHDVRS